MLVIQETVSTQINIITQSVISNQSVNSFGQTENMNINFFDHNHAKSWYEFCEVENFLHCMCVFLRIKNC
jgi:hypothetical protein